MLMEKLCNDDNNSLFLKVTQTYLWKFSTEISYWQYYLIITANLSVMFSSCQALSNFNK